MAETKRIMKALAINGYPRWAYDLARHRTSSDEASPTSATNPPTTDSSPTETAAEQDPSIASPSNGNSQTKCKGFVSLPYYKGTTEPLTRIMRRTGLSAQIRNRGTLREHLVKAKDKLKNNNKTGVVYFAPCAGANNQPCNDNASYVGETSRQGAQRFKEHMSTAKLYNGDYKSAIMHHAASTGHSFRESDLSILDKDPNWRSRGIRESIFIRALNPSLNRRSDRNDRYSLPTTYDSIITATIKKPPPPTPHDRSEKRTFTGDRRQGRQRQAQSNQEEISTMPVAEPATIPKQLHRMTTRRMTRALEGDPGTS